MSATVTIRNVPDEAHAELVARAGLHDQSLQEYLRRRICDLTSKPDMKTLMAGIEKRLRKTGTSIPVERILEHLDASRQ